MNHRILVTLGPSSLEKNIISQLENRYLYLFRINLSHTPIESLENVISEVQSYTKTPICLDSEGAQIRNQSVENGKIFFQEGDTVKIHFSEVIGNANNISFTPNNIVKQFRVGDEIRIDFNSSRIKIFGMDEGHWLASVESAGLVGGNKATDLAREIQLEAITEKDRAAVEIGKRMGIKHYALSFAGAGDQVNQMRELTGEDSTIISKIESRNGLISLNSIIDASDAILIDRGDLSRQIPLAKIPFCQMRIIATARAKDTPVYVATNLLESMVKAREPTRAEVNDVASCLLSGASGLVLASETAVGKYPVESVNMIQTLINQFDRWTPNTTIEEILGS